MLSSSALCNACVEVVEKVNESTVIKSNLSNAELRALSVQYAAQGIHWEEITRTLWCALCTAHVIKDTHVPLNSCLVTVGNSEKDIRMHCATKDHLLRYEEKNAVHHGCPVEIHGHKMILENHCVYPATAFGPGRMLMDISLAHKCLLAQDVCGAIKLTPHHQYLLTEFIIPQHEENSPPTSKMRCEGSAKPRYFNSRGDLNYTYHPRTFRVDEMLRRSNINFSLREAQWHSSDYLPES